MSFHVSMDSVEIDQNFYNLSFIILKNSTPPDGWSRFFRRVNWDKSVKIPKNFYILDLGHNGCHFFHPCAPFHLTADDCSSWLTWSIVRPNKGKNDEIKMLQFRFNPAEVLQNPETKTGISAHLQHSLWADQLLSEQQLSCTNLPQLEQFIRQEINSQLRKTTSIIQNKVRNELRKHGRDRRTFNKPYSITPPKNQSEIQAVPPQQYYLPQQQGIPSNTSFTPALSQQPVLFSQPTQWNSAITAYNPQPSTSYASKPCSFFNTSKQLSHSCHRCNLTFHN